MARRQELSFAWLDMVAALCCCLLFAFELRACPALPRALLPTIVLRRLAVSGAALTALRISQAFCASLPGRPPHSFSFFAA
jgi:hypothetical protein